MKRGDENRVLREILSGDQPDGFRDVSLDRALIAMRRHRRNRRGARITAMLVLIAAFATIAGFLRHPLRPATPVVVSALPVKTVPSANASSAPAGTKVITDEELLALFPGRAVALVGSPGHQQLVFLDKRARPAAPRPN